ncbi:Protein of unknown function DUF531 [Methanococcus aeolicus Nankai-3]|uniref:DUF531 domain-containing protein n=1 Tax=Methanococcus aeolicus (strain ATCC BAA-1280 / DSM 17508 / OCM 812 / Nankai-3) TaxID=419665 RepID=A6UT28_META3|nr:DUF531 domain-containing protein [Methanococcus aeolicus]ABR55650.1 Protein of unknown function DUF531 [Methanococcus aeolicus Nankai-3]
MKNLKRMTMILYNSYDKNKWHEAHKRAIARAASICYAFECNLAIMNFPCKREDITSIETTIGSSGKYLNELIEKNRFMIVDKYQPQFGVPIITTSKPEPKKAISPKEVAQSLLKKSCGIYVGLGRHGLPKNILKSGELHLDITEKGISLETCTAISAIPSTIYTHSKYL